ncbi:MAG: Cysteine rich repeat [Alphaproteobacteria bacterium]|jgi:hypothetical protein|nr:Cysteine rich repeat [Alphaproteobacteria bacterium]MEA2990088.1 Cysteine rich repeat [Alphaproteobacteria bacterium]
MERTVTTVLVTLLALSAAPTFANAQQRTAQSQGSAQEQAACRPDARRFCRNAGSESYAVLSCLQSHRSQLSRSCRSVLERNGQ